MLFLWYNIFMRKFKNIYVEITKACNLACRFCPSSKNNNHNEYLSFDKFKHLINEIKDYTEGIYLHILGEPLLHKDLFKFIDYASSYLKVSVTTNGHLIKNHLESLVSSNLYVLNISLQSISAVCELDEYFNNLYKLVVNRKNNLAIHLRIWNDKNSETVCNLNKRLYELINQYHLLEYPYVNLSVADEFEWPSLDLDDNLVRSSCLGGKHQMGILLNGDVTICCLDYLGKTKIGNIYEDSFDSLLSKELYKSVLKGWNDLNPYFDLCKKCTYRNRFRKESSHEGHNH